LNQRLSREYNGRSDISTENLDYITEIYDRANRTENLEIASKEEKVAEEEGSYILHSKAEKAIEKMRAKKATRHDDGSGINSDCLETMESKQ
jgi:hypothetical protein